MDNRISTNSGCGTELTDADLEAIYGGLGEGLLPVQPISLQGLLPAQGLPIRGLLPAQGLPIRGLLPTQGLLRL